MNGQHFKKEYLGDGVYADFDGFHIVLTANDGDSDNTIYLDETVMSGLLRYIDYLKEQIVKQEDQGTDR